MFRNNIVYEGRHTADRYLHRGSNDLRVAACSTRSVTLPATRHKSSMTVLWFPNAGM